MARLTRRAFLVATAAVAVATRFVGAWASSHPTIPQTIPFTIDGSGSGSPTVVLSAWSRSVSVQTKKNRGKGRKPR